MYRGGAGQPYGPHHLGLRCAVSWWKHETGQNFRSADGPGQMHDMSDECLRRPHQDPVSATTRAQACVDSSRLLLALAMDATSGTKLERKRLVQQLRVAAPAWRRRRPSSCAAGSLRIAC